jgi:hypothetical protein
MRKVFITLAIVTWVAAISACSETTFKGAAAGSPNQPGTGGPLSPTFSSIQANIFQPRCISCHGTGRTESNINLETYDSLQASSISHGHPLVIAGDPSGSHLLGAVESGAMPQDGPRLSDAEIGAIREWITNGAKND